MEIRCGQGWALGARAVGQSGGAGQSRGHKVALRFLQAHRALVTQGNPVVFPKYQLSLNIIREKSTRTQGPFRTLGSWGPGEPSTHITPI